MANELKHSHGDPLLEQFVLLAETLKGAGLVSLINQLLEAPGVYSFGEFLELPCVKELSVGPSAGYAKLLDLFAYGTYNDYEANKNTLPPLSEAQKNKLRHLTIASLAANTQCIPYSVLQQTLRLASVRQLEDLLIEAVYSDVVRGKLDHLGQHLEVDACVGRDTRFQDAARLGQTLSTWCVSCETVCSAIDLQVDRLRRSGEGRLHTIQQLQAEVCNIHEILSATASSSSSSSAAQSPGQERAPESLEHRASLKDKQSD
ncbi:COP9 signalosome complex subunit 7b-like [Brachyhypopomus gauderio]|uniref:COP9 signalosome complex subunit 7b-like n=1 Tax=Brachyhypopomus gauderio TaxID=698409 RepID=UPI004041B5C3